MTTLAAQLNDPDSPLVRNAHRNRCDQCHAKPGQPMHDTRRTQRRPQRQNHPPRQIGETMTNRAERRAARFTKRGRAERAAFTEHICEHGNWKKTDGNGEPMCPHGCGFEQ